VLNVHHGINQNQESYLPASSKQRKQLY
jgi:hypothetical protein